MSSGAVITRWRASALVNRVSREEAVCTMTALLLVLFDVIDATMVLEGVPPALLTLGQYVDEGRQQSLISHARFQESKSRTDPYVLPRSGHCSGAGTSPATGKLRRGSEG